jgi:hypothetical protein
MNFLNINIWSFYLLQAVFVAFAVAGTKDGRLCEGESFLACRTALWCM